MSELVFVRHGQASFGAESYDKLSASGVHQVKMLAEHWQELGEQFDFAYSGTLRRQLETAQELLGLVKNTSPKHQTHEGFNEYNGDPLIGIYLRDFAREGGFDPELRLPIRDERLFQKVFEAATAKWIRDELQPHTGDQHFESWRQFQQRVHSAIDELMARHSGGSRILISTSGGVIALALQRALRFPDTEVIATNWMVHNSSVTRLRYGNGKISLTMFNSLAHLERPERKHMVTFR
ncbi:MAG: histidine phosphatase family protein [Pseudohongiellaceae bacterium]